MRYALLLIAMFGDIVLFSCMGYLGFMIVTGETTILGGILMIAIVGCGRTTCADTGADYAGTWGFDGVHRRPTAFELLMDNPDSKMIIQNDLTNPNSKPEIIK